MNTSTLTFSDVSYRYPPVTEPGTDAAENPFIFSHFSADIPGGFTCLTGPNGSGKTTFMLLAGGRVLPEHGSVTLCGVDTKYIQSEEQRNELCSFIYQNMEFETEEKTAALLDAVLSSGTYAQNGKTILSDCINVFSLTPVLDRPLAHLSKSEMQRVLLAFSVLYGSRVIMMDEPMFAMEQKHKEAALEFLSSYSKEKNVALYLSLHELELARTYARTVMLFFPDRTISLGSPFEVLTNEDLEKAYGVPAAMLKQKETLDRNTLIEQSLVMNAQSHTGN